MALAQHCLVGDPRAPFPALPCGRGESSNLSCSSSHLGIALSSCLLVRMLVRLQGGAPESIRGKEHQTGPGIPAVPRRAAVVQKGKQGATSMCFSAAHHQISTTEMHEHLKIMRDQNPRELMLVLRETRMWLKGRVG